MACGSPEKSGSPAVIADEIRARYATEGAVTVSFLRQVLPEAEISFIEHLTTALNNDDSQGYLDDSERKAFQEKFGDRQSALLGDLDQKTPWLARLQWLSETAREWCWRDACKETRYDARDILGGMTWLGAGELSPQEQQTAIEIGAKIFHETPDILGWSFARDFRDFAGEDLQKEIAVYYRARLLGKTSQERDTASLAFINNEEELKSIANQALEKGEEPIRALELLARVFSLGHKAEKEEQLVRYKTLAEQNPQNAFYQYAAAFWAHSVGENGDTAVSFAKRAVQLDPTQSAYWWNLYEVLPEGEEKFGALQKAYDLNPEDSLIVEALVRVAVSMRKFDIAKKYLDKIRLLPHSNSDMFFLWLGSDFLVNKKIPEGKECGQRFLKITSSSPNSWEWVRELLSSYFSSADRVELFQQAVEYSPLDGNNWEELGKAKEELGQKEAALQAYEKGGMYGSIGSLRALARIYKANENKERLLETLQKISDHVEATAEDHYNLGSAQASSESSFAEAPKAYEKAVAKDPENGLYHDELGVVYTLLNQKEKADFHLQIGNTLSRKKSAEQQVDLGLPLLNLDRFSEALPLFQKAVALNPENAYAHLSLARVYRGLQKNDLAEQHFNRVKKLESDWMHAEAAFELIELKRKRGALSEALQEAEALLQTSPDDFNYLYAYAQCALDSGNHYAVQKAMEKVTGNLIAAKDYKGDSNEIKKYFDLLRQSFERRGMTKEAQAANQQWVDWFLAVPK